jgi:hypothetical protein
MALVLKDRVQETTTTTGTGTITLLGAVAGYQAFSAVGNANTTYYTIAGQTTSEWEVGIGTYTLSGTTLSRDTVLASSNSGSLVTFSAGTKNVFLVYPSSRSIYADGAVLTATNSAILPTSAGGTGNSTGSATLVAQTGAVATAATYYPTFVAANTTSNQAHNTATAFTFNPSTGALSATSHVSSSDERKKTNWRDLPEDFIEQLALVKNGIYDRIEGGNTEVGVGGQSLQKVLNQAVISDDEGFLSVMYGNVALVACIKLAERVLELEAKLKDKQ